MIDERPVIGRGISTILDATDGIRLVDRLSEAAAVEKSCGYDVLVLGIHTSHVIRLLRLVDVLAGRCRLVLFSSSLELAATLALFDLGHGYLTVDASEQALRDAVLHAADGRQYLDHLIADAFRQCSRATAPCLSPREAELLHHLADGLTHAQAAARWESPWAPRKPTSAESAPSSPSPALYSWPELSATRTCYACSRATADGSEPAAIRILRRLDDAGKGSLINPILRRTSPCGLRADRVGGVALLVDASLVTLASACRSVTAASR